MKGQGKGGGFKQTTWRRPAPDLHPWLPFLYKVEGATSLNNIHEAGRHAFLPTGDITAPYAHLLRVRNISSVNIVDREREGDHMTCILEVNYHPPLLSARPPYWSNIVERESDHITCLLGVNHDLKPSSSTVSFPPWTFEL